MAEPTTYPQTNFLIRLTLVFWLIAKAFCWRTWTGEHFFPMAPVFDFLDAVPLSIHIGLFFISMVTAVVLLAVPERRALLFLLFASEIFSCLLDQNRWQPWEYQYLFMTLIFVVNIRKPQFIYSSLLFILISTYFYSGLQKVNAGFEYVVWENVILKVLFPAHSRVWPSWAQMTGYVIPFLEMSGAVGLYFQSTRRRAGFFLIAMHVFNLYILGPLGLNYNPVVWPWNVMMCIVIYVLAIDPKCNFEFDIKELWPGWNKVILICWGILPVLNFWNLWDNYLSCNLYSGRLPIVTICVKAESLPKELETYTQEQDLYQICNGNAIIDMQLWAMKEMNVPPYPELRVIKKVHDRFMAKYPQADARFLYNSYPYIKENWKEVK